MPSLPVPGGALHYEVSELTGPWIHHPETILFHHGLGASLGIWADWLPSLIDRYRIVRFDLRGHGRSQGFDPEQRFSLDDLTEDLFAVADAAGATHFHAVGESMGGTIALNGAVRRPQRIKTLTVSNGAHLGGSIANVRNWEEIIAQRGMAGWSAHMMERRFFSGAISQAQWQWYEHQQAGASPRILLRALDLLVGADLSQRLSEIRVPVLLLHPDSSPFIPVGVMADFQAGLPDGRLLVVPHARHGLPFSHAALCAQTLRGFLAEREGSR